MGKSFYLTNKMEDLRSGSQTFSNLIVAQPTLYSLTALQAAAYKTLNDDFAELFDLAKAPETRTKVTLVNRDQAAIALKQKAAELAKIIEGSPTVTPGQKTQLGLSVRATPQPSPPPGTCSNFKVELLANGSILVKFKANNPKGLSGVVYQVWRRIGDVGTFSYLTATGEKKFVDSTIPLGASQLTYQIQGIRPTAAGQWAQFNVTFGSASATGVATASVVETKAEPRLAA